MAAQTMIAGPARVLLGLLAALVLVTGCSSPPMDTEHAIVEVHGHIFTLEYAVDPLARRDGLMNRTHLPPDGGMLFVFPDAAYRTFWMAHCLVDIDLIFLDARGHITALHRMVALRPQGEDESETAYEARVREKSYPSFFRAQFALEFQAGTIDRIGLVFDEKIDLDLDRLKRLAR